MTFREINARFLVPLAQALMILGIIALCQPWSLGLHRYGLTITLVGLVGFMVATKIQPGKQIDPDDLNPFDTVPSARHDPLRPMADDPRDRP